MTSSDEIRLSTQTQRRRYAARVMSGAETIARKPLLLAAFAAVLAVAGTAFFHREEIAAMFFAELLVPMMVSLSTFLIPTLTVVALLLMLIVIGTPKGADVIADDLHRAGIINKVDEPPILMHRYLSKDSPRVSVLDFRAVGISRSTWEDLQPQVEAALNCYVVGIQDGKFRNRVLLHIVPSGTEIPKVICWSKDHAAENSSTLVLGQTVAGTDVMVDLAQIPHILIGGSTGSGKSVLLKHLLAQGIEKGMKVYIADFKGGVDFGAYWAGHSTLVCAMDELVPLLDRLVEEMERRKRLLRDTGAVNIDAYNQKTGTHLQRIIFACDEVAELLDKTGASKELKSDIDQVVSRLSSIARLGRAFGIHLILSTQRPDANIMPGQIKNNIDCRVCGRADNVLSQIILDKTDAADLIPKDSHKFLMNDGTIFQPYLFDEGELI